MNKGTIINNLGKIIMVEAVLMIPSLIISLAYGENEDAFGFLITIIPALVLAFLCTRVKGGKLGPKDGYFIVASAWIIISLIGAVPLYMSDAFSSYIAALFEIVSGFTTTGASVLADPGVLGHGVQFFRCFSHWIGGMGVLVFVLMIMPMENDSSMHLVRAEVPGPIAGKIVPKMSVTSRILYGIYAGITVILIILLKIFKMPLFDACCYAFATTGTGGFSINSAGLGLYENSVAIEYIISIFMLLCGVNFNIYYLILLGKLREVFKSEELKVYFGIVLAAVTMVSFDIFKMAGSFGNTVRLSLFQVSSIITTTGFATADFSLWPQFSQHVLVLLMIIGACAGSTAGGMKISRVIILWKSFIAEIKSIINPRQIVTVRINRQVVPERTLQSTRIYASAYLLIVCLSVLILSLNELDFTTNVTAVLACFNNIGPGLSLVGPMSNFSVFSDPAKLWLSIIMLTGRLEIFPMFLLFAKSAHEK